MNELKIVFSTSNHFISKLIRKVMNCPASHVFFVFNVYDKKLMLEAGFLGIKFSNYEKYTESHKIVAEYDITHIVDGRKYINDSMEYLDEKYDFGGLVGTLFVLIGRWLHASWNNPLNSSKAMFCSEYVTTVLKNNEFQGIQSNTPSKTTPKDLLILFTSLNLSNLITTK